MNFHNKILEFCFVLFFLKINDPRRQLLYVHVFTGDHLEQLDTNNPGTSN